MQTTKPTRKAIAPYSTCIKPCLSRIGSGQGTGFGFTSMCTNPIRWHSYFLATIRVFFPFAFD